MLFVETHADEKPSHTTSTFGPANIDREDPLKEREPAWT